MIERFKISGVDGFRVGDVVEVEMGWGERRTGVVESEGPPVVVLLIPVSEDT